jgi:predicted TPR repeat methyltransferase
MQPTGRNAPPTPAIGSGAFEDAVGLYGRGQVLEAEAACKSILMATPAHVGALTLAGRIAAECGRLTEAVHLLTTATSAAPHDGGLHRELGKLLIKLGRPRDAVAILHRAIALTPKSPPYDILAVALLGLQLIEEAEAACRKMLNLDSQHAETYITMAECQRRRGDPEEAMRSLQTARQLAPNNVEAMVALADVYIAVGKFPKAAAQYREAIAASARPAAIYMSLAMALKSMGDMTAALEALQVAVSAEPSWAQCHYLLAQTLLEDKQIAEAINRVQIAVSLQPDYIAAHALHGAALAARGEVDAGLARLSAGLRNANSRSECLALLANQLAAAGYRHQAVLCLEKRLESEPEDAAIRHEIAALRGSNPANAPREFVRQLFDDYAEAFDRSLLRGLAYSVPRELAEAVVAASGYGPPWDILDLGCGTGLIGSLFAADARSMVGVDLSERMIARSRERGIYSRLICADLLESLERMPPAIFDLVVAADVFVYVGKLDAVMPAVRRVLRPAGTFAFSAEDLEEGPDADRAHGDAGYWLHSRARYAHRLDYLKGLAAQSEFEIKNVRETRIRFEQGRPVHGWVMVWSASSNQQPSIFC